MKLIDRYIAAAILAASMLVLLVLVSLNAVISFIRQLDDIGQGNYGFADALAYVALRLPDNAVQMFSTSVLLGSLLGLGAMASHSELIVMRAAGMSIQRIIRATLQAGLLLMLLVAALGEFVSPLAEVEARQMRMAALSKQVSVGSRGGLWAREGERYINARSVLPDLTLRRLTVYEYAADGALREAVAAEAALPVAGGGWELRDLRRTRFAVDGVSVEGAEREIWSGLVSREVIQVLAVDAETLSGRDLYEHIRYLTRNGLDTERYELALWRKLATPLSALVMMLLALPMVFGSLRASGAGQRIFFGALIGIGYLLAEKLFAHLGLVYGLPPLVSAFLPMALFAAVALEALRRQR